MSTDDSGLRWTAAQARFERAMQAYRADVQSPAAQTEYWQAHNAMLVVERECAAARNEPHAIPLDFPIAWDTGSPCPHLLCHEYVALLTFRVRETTNSGPPSLLDREPDELPGPLALVEFRPCLAVKLGTPNDEVHDGHPLHGRGLESDTAQEVVQSRWLAELESINRAHPLYNSLFWRSQKHYVFWFHDSTFECLAPSFRVEVFRETLPAMLVRMAQRLQT